MCWMNEWMNEWIRQLILCQLDMVLRGASHNSYSFGAACNAHVWIDDITRMFSEKFWHFSKSVNRELLSDLFLKFPVTRFERKFCVTFLAYTVERKCCLFCIQISIGHTTVGWSCSDSCFLQAYPVEDILTNFSRNNRGTDIIAKLNGGEYCTREERVVMIKVLGKYLMNNCKV